MQEYQDGSFGEIKNHKALKELLENPEEMAKIKAIHFGTEKQLQTMKEAVCCGMNMQLRIKKGGWQFFCWKCGEKLKAV